MSPSSRENAPYLELLLAVCALCSEAVVNSKGDGTRFEGSPTEVALLELGKNSYVEIEGIRNKFSLLHLEPRAEGRIFMVTIHEAPSRRS